MVTREPPRFLLNYIPISKPKITSIRGGTSFWVTAGNAGVRSSLLTVPVTYPPEIVPNGEMLSGLPLPDIRGTMGTFYYFGTDLSRYEEGNTEFGGILKRLVFDGDVAQTELVGPPNPIVRQQLRAARAKTPRSEPDKMKIAELEAREDIRVPLTVHWNRAAKSATVDLGDSTIHLAEGQWSKWINLDFSINMLVRVHGMAQLYLIRAGPELQLYVSPVNWRPDNPPAPMSSPASFAADIYERLGPYRTLGWAEATWPLNEDRIDEKTFMEDLYRAFDDRAQVILQRIDSKQWDLLVGVIESTDRVQHMMWRLIDPAPPDVRQGARRGVRRFDRAGLPKVRRVCRRSRRARRSRDADPDRLGPRLPLVPPVGEPEHLARAGRLHGDSGPAAGRKDAQGPVRRRHVLGKRRLDAHQGVRDGARPDLREPAGPRRPRPRLARRLEAVQDDLAARLLTMTDPTTGARMVDAVYKRDDIYKGPFLNNASELQVGLADGYRVSWQSTLGGSPPGIVYPNMKKWSGDHGSYDYKQTAGVLISSRPLADGPTDIMDIAPTVLKYFGVPIPSDIDGKPIF